MDQGAPLKDIAIDIEITEEEEEVSSLLDQREINPNDAPDVTEAQTEGQDSLAAHSNTKALIKDRDPKGINKYLEVTFEDVIAEPASVSSFDKVWLWSHALFEVSRLWFYRIISLLLAVPVALVAGVLFAVLSCLHIWLIVPSVRLLVINLHWIKMIWHNVLNTAISPSSEALGSAGDSSELVWKNINHITELKNQLLKAKDSRKLYKYIYMIYMYVSSVSCNVGHANAIDFFFLLIVEVFIIFSNQ